MTQNLLLTLLLASSASAAVLRRFVGPYNNATHVSSNPNINPINGLPVVPVTGSAASSHSKTLAAYTPPPLSALTPTWQSSPKFNSIPLEIVPLVSTQFGGVNTVVPYSHFSQTVSLRTYKPIGRLSSTEASPSKPISTEAPLSRSSAPVTHSSSAESTTTIRKTRTITFTSIVTVQPSTPLPAPPMETNASGVSSMNKPLPTQPSINTTVPLQIVPISPAPQPTTAVPIRIIPILSETLTPLPPYHPPREI